MVHNSCRVTVAVQLVTKLSDRYVGNRLFRKGVDKMSRQTTFGFSFLAVIASSAILSAQPVDPPHNPTNKDAEAHYKSRPQRTTPRVKIPNTDLLDNDPLPPIDPADEQGTLPTEGRPIDPKEVEARADAAPRRVVRVEARGPRTDLVLATSVALANHEEILISQEAGERSQHPDVRKFAQMMAREHGVFLDKLRKFAPEAARDGYLENVGLPARTAAPVAPVVAVEATDFKVNVELPTASRTRKTDTFSSVPQLMRIERDLAVQSLASDREMLSQKTGLAFDESYLGQQLAIHMAMKNKLAVYRPRVSSELALVFAEAQAQAEQHWKQAFDLMQTLDAGEKAPEAAPKKTVQAPVNRIRIDSKAQAKD
jgi:predicted outer membrane protein